jgi:hypothetical protein
MAPDLESAKVKARSLFDTLNMPQNPDGAAAMSALCQKRTFCTAVRDVVIRSPRRRDRTAKAER